MHASEYLYGTDVEVPQIPQNIVETRIALLEDNLASILDVNYLIRDLDRERAVIKAISHWRNINE